jgi:hypothetical protein
MEPDESRPASRPKPSKIPSWIMLGFLLGAIFVWALPHPRESVARDPAPAAVVERPVLSSIPTHPRLTDVEAVFEEWGNQYALWAGDTTYVCMWDSESKTYRDCFQVIRRGDDLFFFRSISRPRNLRARDGVPTGSPLEFLNPEPEVRGLFGERLTAPVIDRAVPPRTDFKTP